jgi:hypothetical protein
LKERNKVSQKKTSTQIKDRQTLGGQPHKPFTETNLKQNARKKTYIQKIKILQTYEEKKLRKILCTKVW